MLLFADSTAGYDSEASSAILKNWGTATNNASYRQAGAWGAGSYSMQFMNWNYTQGQKSVNIPSSTTATLGFRFKISGTGTGALGSVVHFGSQVAASVPSGVNAIHIYNGATDVGSVSYTVSTWNYLEVQVTISSTVGAITAWLNGTQFYSDTSLNTGTTPISYVQFGNDNGIGNTSGIFLNLTDIYVTDTTNTDGAGQTGNLGPIRIENPAPTGDGANTAWTVAVGANAASANQYNPTATTGFVADSNCAIGNGAITGTIPAPYETFGFTNQLTYTSSGSPSVVTTSAGTSGYAVTAGNAYTASALITCTTGPIPTFQLGIRWYTSGGTAIQTDLNTAFSAGTGTFVVAYLNGTAPATAAFAAIVVQDTSGVGATRWITGVSFTPTPATLSSGQVFTGAIIKNPSLSGTAHYVNINDAVADSGTFNRSPGTPTNVGDKDTYTIASLNSTTGTPLAVVVTNVAMKENSNPRSIAPVLRYGSGPSSGVRYTNLSSTTSHDRAYDATVNTMKQLSDGTLVWLETDGGSNIELMYSFDHQNSVQIAQFANTNFSNANVGALALVVDASDNIYIIGVDNAAKTTISVQCYKKTLGQYAWTAQTRLTSATTVTAALNLVAEWCNTGGGTSSAGHIIVFTSCTTASSNVCQTLDAGTALAGTGTLFVNNYTNPSCCSNTFTNQSHLQLDISQDGFGNTRGMIMLCPNPGTSNFYIGWWSISNVGVLTSITQSSIDGCQGKLRVSHWGASGSGTWNIYSYQTLNSHVTAGSIVWAATFITAGSGSGLANMNKGDISNWDIYHNSTNNTDYLVYYSSNLLTQVPISYSSSSWPTAGSSSTIDTVLTNSYTFGGIRTCKQPTQSAFFDIQFYANLGTTYALYGDWTGTGSVPGNFVGTSQALNNDLAYHAYQNIWALNPATGLPWTINQTNAIEAGIEISA